MKKLILATCAVLLSFSATATTLNPIQLLNPAGSAPGQVVTSTGPTTAPAWTNVSISTLTGVLPVLQGGTGATTSAGALTNLGALSTTTAASTYLTQATAASTYATITNLALKAPLAAPLSQFAATTSAQLAGVISDETGTGSLVFGTSPALTTPAISGGTINSASVGATTPSTGAFTTLSASGLITPTSNIGIKGTAAADSAQAGSVGEFVTASAASISVSTTTVTNAASVSLTAGDWDVSGAVQFVPAGTTVASLYIAGVSTVSGSRGPFSGENVQILSFPAGQAQTLPTPTTRISIAATTTVYLVVESIFTTSTMTANILIRARRVR